MTIGRLGITSNWVDRPIERTSTLVRLIFTGTVFAEEGDGSEGEEKDDQAG